MRVSVVIPTYNEAGSIAHVPDDIPPVLVSEVLVVDAGSTDGTREIAAGRGARVIVEPRRGYGRACLTGLAAANVPDIVVFLDGDYSDRPRELGRLIEPIRQGQADIVLGSRLAGGLAPGAMPWHAELGNRLAATLSRWLYGISLTDLGPFRAARSEVLRALEIKTYDLILLDVQMPEMDGYETARNIRKKWAAGEGNRPRILAMTSNAMQGDREKCLEAGMDDYITKPVRVEELRLALERCAERQAAI